METDEIVRYLDVLAITPVSSDTPHGLLIAANRAMLEERYADAREDYVRALEDLPGHPETHHNLAIALARLGEWDAAADQMRQACDLAPRDPAFGEEYLALETDAGIQAAQRDDLEEAARHFLRILNIRPDEPTALANLGNIRLREERTNEAKAIFRRFLRRHPRHAAADTIRLALEKLDGDDAQ